MNKRIPSQTGWLACELAKLRSENTALKLEKRSANADNLNLRLRVQDLESKLASAYKNGKRKTRLTPRSGNRRGSGGDAVAVDPGSRPPG